MNGLTAQFVRRNISADLLKRLSSWNWNPHTAPSTGSHRYMGERHLCTAVADSLTALTRWRRFVLRTSTAAIISPQMQCHPMPWERLINICIQVILVPNPPFLPCHLFCLGIASSGWDSEEAAGQTSSAWKLPPSSRRFSSVQQFSRLTTISSICVSCHHNGLRASGSGHFAIGF